MAHVRALSLHYPNPRIALRLPTAFTLLLFLIVATPARADHGATHRFVIVLAESVERPADVAAEHQHRYGGDILHVYNHALNGYAAALPEDGAAAIARDPRVLFVEPDQIVNTLGQTLPTGISRISATANPEIGIDGRDDIRVDVDIAIIDTGVDLDHADLDVVSSADCIGTDILSGCREGGQDDNGHGTHVAGTAAAIDNDFGVVGVAPGARLHAVKVLTASGDGLMSDVVAAVDWVTARADTIEVANMSLGCRCTMASLDRAIAGSVEAGIVHAVAAGNSDRDAQNYSPAGHPDVITVSALADFDGTSGGLGAATCRSDEDDSLADFSNWGAAVDVAAPGTCIYSTSTLGGYATMSGTSMASPHVAGGAALLVSGANDARTRREVEAVRSAIISSGNSAWVDDSGDGINEPLLDVGNAEVFVVNSAERTLGSSPPPPDDPPTNEVPIASFTHACSDLECRFDGSSSSDADGMLSSYTWDFGDGSTATSSVVDKTYGSSGTYTVTLTVVDDSGASDSVVQDVVVRAPTNSSGDFRLMGTAVRTVGGQTTSLNWSGTDLSGNVVIFRNGDAIATTSDDGSFTDVVEDPSGSYVYKVCEENTMRCSNEVRLF